ncbi:MAG: DUF1571 domain-containing protein [Acidobacteriota bacterium]|nr:DUF1571 domain-containing protein [Acidobacteriota bacterium]
MKQGKLLAHGFVIAALLCLCCIACRSEHRVENNNSLAEQHNPSDSPAPSRLPITWIEVAGSYERLSDYVCLYEKEERAISKGELQTIRLFFRKPFDVRLEWLNDNGKVDQIAVYRQGLNNGNVIARQSGLLGTLAGKLQLDPNDPLALTDSRHPITEIGFGKLIERIQNDAKNPGITARFTGEEVLDGRPAYKIEFNASEDQSVGGLAAARQAFLWIDRELKLPAKLELYDRNNVLLERHRFKDVKVDQKLSDKTFTP